MAGEPYVDHDVLKAFAQGKVNVPKEEAKERRRQVNYLRERLEDYIADHPDFDLVKLRASGSVAKHTAIRRRKGEGSDADVAAYLRVADPEVDVATVLDWLRKRCIEVYGKTKVAEDFVPSDHAVGITMRGTGLKIDVVPVLYTGEPDDRGYLVTSQGIKVLTSVTLHLQFIKKRKDAAGDAYRELIRLLKAWIRESKSVDPDLRCKSFLIELLVAHLWETGWNGEPLQVNDYPRAFEQVLSYIVRTGLREPIVFTDYYKANEVSSSNASIQVWDPVNPENNVASTYTELDRQRLVKHAKTTLDTISWAAHATTKGDAIDAWRELFGPAFPGA
ncbi:MULTISPECIES: CBASS oligonucleotide cyclase [Streptomyces]|uniref:CBASS oligonucleotide cyclase n=1 Tax=Streptomyces edwardsiae TaxID=3075527 RepID=A0ABU2PT98_9ACTN|nr:MULTISPECIES: CBASS oligonucleotide cyclase [unclassified Streptomyces]MDT0395382.1 CBASS oligonucleotide cyclase [Streptomyces sp. DSM 41636]TFE55368.1 nucleotidyltransferase [Streptomyces sp. ICN441]